MPGEGTRGGMGRKMGSDKFNASHHRQSRLAQEPSMFALLLLRARDLKKLTQKRTHTTHPRKKERRMFPAPYPFPLTTYKYVRSSWFR